LTAYEVHRLDAIDPIPVSSADVTWLPVRRALGITAFGINAYTADAEGKHVVEEHDEATLGHEEVYVVVSGRARFTLGEDEHEVAAGSLVYVRDPATRRSAIALEPNTTVLAIGGKRGEAFAPSAWESWYVASPAMASGDYAGAAEIMRTELDRIGDHPSLLYNLACAESMAGNADAAIGYLGRARGLEPERVAKWAAGVSDLHAIRDDPRYPVR